MAEESSSSSSTSLSSTSSGVIESPFALLEAVENAIKAVCAMQSYRLGDRTVTYANLAELRELRRELMAEIGQRQGTRPRVSSFNLDGAFV